MEFTFKRGIAACPSLWSEELNGSKNVCRLRAHPRIFPEVKAAIAIYRKPKPMMDAIGSYDGPPSVGNGKPT